MPSKVQKYVTYMYNVYRRTCNQVKFYGMYVFSKIYGLNVSMSAQIASVHSLGMRLKIYFQTSEIVSPLPTFRHVIVEQIYRYTGMTYYVNWCCSDSIRIQFSFEYVQYFRISLN